MESAKLWILVAVVCVICTSVTEANQKPSSVTAARSAATEKLSNAVQGKTAFAYT